MRDIAAIQEEQPLLQIDCGRSSQKRNQAAKIQGRLQTDS